MGLVTVDPPPDTTPQPTTLELWRDGLQADATAGWLYNYDACCKFWDSAWGDRDTNPGLTCEKIAQLHADDFVMLLTFVGALQATAVKAGASQTRIDRLNEISAPPTGWTATPGADGTMTATPPHEQV